MFLALPLIALSHNAPRRVEPQKGPPATYISNLDALAKSRDVAGLTKYLEAVPHHNPFNVLRTGGAYAAGQRGWTVQPLATPDGVKFVVFSTPIIVEDMGELLFQLMPDGKLKYVPETDSLGVALDQHRLNVRFDLPNHKLIATDGIDCHWAARPRSHFFFRISPTYTLRSLVDEHQRPVPFTQAGGIIAVAPKTAKLHFFARYDGTNLMPGFDRLIGPQEATLSGSVWYLTIAREPAPYDITIHYPKTWTAIAQGDEVSTETTPTEKVSKFHNPVPVVWFSASAGPYKTVVSKIGGREYATMSQTMTTQQMQDQNVFNSEVVSFYSSHFTPYPFKRWTALDSVEFHGGPGALEAYSFATYPGGLPDQDSHEPSHTWWGGIVPNDYLKSFWNESFANYCMGLFARNRPIGNQAELRLANVFPSYGMPPYNAAPLSDAGDEIGPAAAALGYGKGPVVLQMLEDEMGTDKMVDCMKEFARTNPQRHIATWDDFERVVDRVTGRDYKWFFDEWVRRPGYPDFKLTGVTWSEGHPGTVDGTLTFTGQPYVFSTDVLWRGPGNAEGMAKNVQIRPDASGVCHFSIPIPAGKPDLVVVDPWGKILRKRDEDETQPTLEEATMTFRTFIDPRHKDYLETARSQNVAATLPGDLSQTLLIGSPDGEPAMVNLCKQVGFEVSGNNLTYKGTTIDLRHGGAMALVDLPGGGRCAIGLGTCRYRPQFGRARLLVFDELGRPLRAQTDPITTGRLAFRFSK